ncbi:MAG: hypothetical protein GX593_08945 [Actinomycetales bacterium]|nr:hypothetical protein [Actinomycetales bacterium]
MTTTDPSAEPWDEDEYLETLEEERRAFAWVLRTEGGFSPTAALDAAIEHYPVEPADSAQRGLVFHDEAWHWALLRLYGEGYWRERPELAKPSAAYRAQAHLA